MHEKNQDIEEILEKYVVCLSDGIRLRNFLLFCCSFNESSAEKVTSTLTNMLRKSKNKTSKGVITNVLQ